MTGPHQRALAGLGCGDDALPGYRCRRKNNEREKGGSTQVTPFQALKPLSFHSLCTRIAVIVTAVASTAPPVAVSQPQIHAKTRESPPASATGVSLFRTSAAPC